MSRARESTSPSGPPRRRYSLLVLIVPVVLYVLTPVVANTIEPRIFGMPFIVTYTIIVRDPTRAPQGVGDIAVAE